MGKLNLEARMTIQHLQSRGISQSEIARHLVTLQELHAPRFSARLSEVGQAESAEVGGKAQELQRHFAAELLSLRYVNRPHTPGSQQPRDAVMRYGSPDHRG